MTALSRGPFTTRIVRAELGRLWMQRTEESGPRVLHGYSDMQRVAVVFETRPGSEMTWNGVVVEADSLAIMETGRHYHQRFSRTPRWGSISLPVSETGALLGEIIGREPDLRARARPIRAGAEAIGRLRRLHAKIVRLAERPSAPPGSPDATRGLEQALTLAIAHCVADAPEPHGDAAWRRREITIRRLRAFMTANADKALYIPEICEAIGVSDRTLRACCQDYFGMGPNRYLLLRRMHLAHQRLLAVGPGEATVTEIAMQYGFWELGRFAVEYRRIFGERPSATLRAPAARSLRSNSAEFAEFA
ncbi:MAG: helix-turn-helix domain-containing protein [Alphaproteobacteria bacterium]|nr:helix-turn-helix domain-containing protein [Alphaproteobacteria bacterium]